MATQAQIEANRRNRKCWKEHTPAGLNRLREAALRNRPWLKSTGPRTPEGKARSKWSASKHGQRGAEAIANRKALAEIIRDLRSLGFL